MYRTLTDVLYMNYTKIYASIVLRAQSERTERLSLKKHGQYFEDHHIIPRSLNGIDDVSNMALLTGREHFICHWLLVKIYKPNTVEYSKMIIALWRMRTVGKDHHGRYINARTYEYLREDYARAIGKITSIAQQGSNNSQYGAKWYTNSYDGTVIKSKAVLKFPWVLGRNLFKGESVCIQTSKQHMKLYAQNLWNKFHSGNYTSVREFQRRECITGALVSRFFLNHIPLYRTLNANGRKKVLPNKELIDKFE